MPNYTPVKLAFRIFEPVNGADNSLSPIIFLHGLTCTMEHWMNIPRVIVDRTRRKAYAFDARNHGDSEYTNDFNFDTNVDDLFHFMDTINVAKAILIGNSMGGVTAIRAALRKPQRVEALFCEEMYSKKLPIEIINAIKEHVKLLKRGVEKIPKGLSKTEAEAFTIYYLCNHSAKNVPFINEEKRKKMILKLNCLPEGTYSLVFNEEVITKAMNSPDTLMSETSGRFGGPAYFIYGRLSLFHVDREVENIKKHFPRVKFIEFKRAAHDLHFEFPEEFTETILRYLETRS